MRIKVDRLAAVVSLVLLVTQVAEAGASNLRPFAADRMEKVL